MADLERALVHGLLDERAVGALPPPGQRGHLVVDQSARRRPADLEGHGVPRVPVPARDHLVPLTSIAIVVPLGATLDRAPLVLGPSAGGIDALFWHADSLARGVLRSCRSARCWSSPREAPHRRHRHRATATWARLLLHSEPDPELTATVVDARSARRGSSPRPTPSAAASSATCTTERSSASSPVSLKLGMAPQAPGRRRATAWRCSSSTRRRRSRAHALERAARPRARHPPRGRSTDRGLAAALRGARVAARPCRT